MTHITRQIITRTIPGTAITEARTTTANNPLLTLQVETGHQDCSPAQSDSYVWTFLLWTGAAGAVSRALVIS
jgi:hypothetical protein